MERELMKKSLQQMYDTAHIHRAHMVAYDQPGYPNPESQALFQAYQLFCGDTDAFIRRERLGDKRYAELFAQMLDRFHALEKEYARLMALKKPKEEKKIVTEFEVGENGKGQGMLKMKRGGSREGAGRKKSDYVARKVSLALLPEHWEYFDDVLERRQQLEPKLTQSDLLRQIFEISMRRREPE